MNAGDPGQVISFPESGAREGFCDIEDYAIIGNCRTAALISKNGSLDWLCLPRFDSPSFFCATLDAHKGGRFRVGPTARSSVHREYLQDTNILQTTFSTSTGKVRLTDLMPVASEEEKGKYLWHDHLILRRLEGIEGEVEVEVLCDPRPRYAQQLPRISEHRKLGTWLEYRDQVAILLSDIPVKPRQDGEGVAGRRTIRSGDTVYVCLSFAHGEPAIIPPPGSEVEQLFEVSLNWWRNWVRQCKYEGPYREAVVRSGLALKLLSYAPSGAVIAASTTSLPEAIGGKRNYDYRYCWLRDASWTLRAYFDLGFTEEAEAFLRWLLHTTRLSWPQLQTVYDIHGETDIDEYQLEHLEGYRGSKPVRVGNRAKSQFQLDIYGELISTAFEFVRRGGHLDKGEAHMLAGLGETVCRCWERADKTIWEIPGDPRQFTYSKGMAWVALNRLIQLDKKGIAQVNVERFRKVQEKIRQAIEEKGFNKRLNRYVSTFDKEDLDASLIQLGLTGYCKPDAPAMIETVKAIRKELVENGLMRRYRNDFDSLSSKEGAFGICGFWLVQYLVRLGEKEDARKEFEYLLRFANDIGLYSEELDPDSGAFLGNIPQAFTHVGLINAALALTDREDNP